MKRRAFITLLGGAAAAWLLAARAQSGTVLRWVGVLSPGTPERHARDPRFRAFYETMRELGWAEGVNLTYGPSGCCNWRRNSPASNPT
jgi:putative ABC transport system substrate-binding protein